MSASQTQPRINFQYLDAVRISLNIEKEGLTFYKKAARNAKRQNVKDLFTRLVHEEEEHIRILQAKERVLRPVLKGGSNLSRQGMDAFISKELKGKIFPEGKDGLARIAAIEHDFEALDFGIESEKRSIEVLTRLLMQERKIDVRAIFSHLVVEEKRHLAALQELRKNLPN